MAPSWLVHLQYDWQMLAWRHWIEEFSRDHTLIRFDQRGCGLSDRKVADVSLEAWVQDLEAVVQAAGLERFPLLARSAATSSAIEYALRHPDRVSQLVIQGGAVRPRGRPQADFEALLTLVRLHWGEENPAFRQVFTSMMICDASLEEIQSFNELQRLSVTGEMAARIMMAIAEIDLTNRLPKVATPTLVLHSVEDQTVAFEQGRELASLLPNARLVGLQSRNHRLSATEPAWQVLLSEVRNFLTAGPVAEAVASKTESELLSQREIEVLRLLAEGKSNPEIAKELFISRNTVQNHVSSILIKTNLTNRAQAAVYAKEHGIV
jgi:pimeloyl-ACP methyl ester carboxylesterase/DNA-binding CsgD family transcriptional regulator